jgi:hypothetical protein
VRPAVGVDDPSHDGLWHAPVVAIDDCQKGRLNP